MLAFILALIGLSFKIKGVEQKRLEGAYYLEIDNSTDYAIKIYAPHYKRHISRYQRPQSDKLYGPLPYSIGKPGSEIKIESKTWDRPITIDFKGKEHTFVKKLVLNRKKRKGTTTTFLVTISWPLFSLNDCYCVTIEENNPKELPNFANWIKTFFD